VRRLGDAAVSNNAGVVGSRLAEGPFHSAEHRVRSDLAARGAAMVAPVSREAFKDGSLAGGRKLAKAAGRFAALAGHMPEPYKNVVGA
jgi:hypothetical protein